MSIALDVLAAINVIRQSALAVSEIKALIDGEEELTAEQANDIIESTDAALSRFKDND